VPDPNSIASQSLIFMAPMKRRTNHRRASVAPVYYRLLIAFLAVAYLVVGFAGEIACAEESLFISAAFEVGAIIDKADEGSKATPTVVEHCYSCAPLVMPARVEIAEPSAQPVELSFEALTFLLEDHLELDTPPPKHLT